MRACARRRGIGYGVLFGAIAGVIGALVVKLRGGTA
jgi:hypothetical protein